MKLKVCGMKYNAQEVAELQPDYLGFIFYDKSSRFFDRELFPLASEIQKIGVFVNASVDEICEKIQKYDLQGVQLHGQESPEFCKTLKLKFASTTLSVTILKVFSIKDDFDFKVLEPYEDLCDYFLFDTKGKLPGGNGYTFDWGVLKNYPSTKPYFLSGGIGLAEVDSIKEFMQRPEARYCHAVDVNSRFESKPGLKDISELTTFKKQLDL